MFPPNEKKISDQGSLHQSCEAAISRSWGERSGDREDSPGQDRQTRTAGENAAMIVRTVTRVTDTAAVWADQWPGQQNEQDEIL